MLTVNELYVDSRLKSISLEVKRGECWHLLGANGSGKSTLLLAISQLVSSRGNIRWHDADIRTMDLSALASFRCLLPQQYALYFDIKVRDASVILHQQRTFPSELVDSLNISPLFPKSLMSLSGGELQRVYLALHLSQVWSSIEAGEALVLLDEPTQQLDPFYQEVVMTLIMQIAHRGNVVIQSHHDVNQTIKFATHALLLKQGAIVGSGKVAEIVTTQNMQTLYKQSFLEISGDSEKQRYLVVK